MGMITRAAIRGVKRSAAKKRRRRGTKKHKNMMQIVCGK